MTIKELATDMFWLMVLVLCLSIVIEAICRPIKSMLEQRKVKETQDIITDKLIDATTKELTKQLKKSIKQETNKKS